jgi:hypothetical protein
MHGLKQIAVVTQGDGWHLVGLDAEGRVWFGSPRRTSKGRALTWALMDEIAENEEPPAPSTARPPEEEVMRRPWPARPSP